MVKTALVKEDFDDGRNLLKDLDDNGFPVTAAFWLYLEDSEVWRYMLASPIVDKEGPSDAYEKIQSIITKISPKISITLMNVSVISVKDDLVKLLKSAVSTPPDAIAGIRFTRNRINNVFIEDAYIYRMS